MGYPFNGIGRIGIVTTEGKQDYQEEGLRNYIYQLMLEHMRITIIA
jgi:hypothetical protein